MAKPTTLAREILRVLDGGLVLRKATPGDIEELAAFNAEIHREPDAAGPDVGIAEWTRDLLDGSHPTTGPGDFTVVEDTSTHKIVSTLCLISQTWQYGDVPFGVGRPEIVGTLAEYRRRGLVRLQMEVVHGWSRERGHLAQGITGIPNYYRQFGYEMALELGAGRTGYPFSTPRLPEGQTEPYNIRPASSDDIPFIAGLYQSMQKRQLISCVRGDDLWRYELEGVRQGSVQRRAMRIIETPQGERVGMLQHGLQLYGPGLSVNMFEVVPGVSWAGIIPPVLRYLKALGNRLAEGEKKPEFGAIMYNLGMSHPLYDMTYNRIPRVRPAYTWYLRVPDLSAFVTTIRPVLDERLARSPLNGHTGELRLSFYRDGLKIKLEGGRIAGVEAWKPAQNDEGDVFFPDLTFLQALFGYRDFEELSRMFPDCWAKNDDVRALARFMFPRLHSDVVPVS